MTHHNDIKGIRTSFRTVLLLTALAWVVTSLLASFGYGAEPAADAAADTAGTVQEKFVPGKPRISAGATLELRGEATIAGTEVKLKQVCRWADADKAAFEPVADLVVTRLGPSVPFRALSLAELKTTLQDAGVNLAIIRFAGVTSCTINRSDLATDERAALQDWVDARLGKTPATSPTSFSGGPEGRARGAASSSTTPTLNAALPAAAVVLGKSESESKEYHTLRDLLIADLCERLSLDAASLQMKFNPADERVLALAEPQFKFNVDGRRIRNLGEVTWVVTLVASGGGSTQNVSVTATARAWQDQLVIQKPVAYHQTLRNEDLLDRRTLVDSLSGEPQIKRDQVVGQWAGQELKAGTILTPRLIEPAPLVRSGQLVTISLQQGNVQIKTVARAMEGGSYGQTVRVKNEANNSIYEVTLTGPQEAQMTASPAPSRGSGASGVATAGGN
jgi:flagella basal body P-ring formation protein FlgA